MCGRKLRDSFEHREGRGDHAQREIFIQCLRIHLAQARIEREERLKLRGEGDGAVRHMVVERLLAEVIACEQQPLAPRIPECKREHAAKVLEKIVAVLLVQSDDDLAVAVRQKAMTTLL